MSIEENYPEGVLRQRRNFLLASALFSAFLFLDIEFTEVQVFGINFLLHNKENLIWIVFFWWCYLFWRFYQYHREIRVDGIAREYNSVVFDITKPIIERQARSEFPDFLNDYAVSYHVVKPITWMRSAFKGVLIFPTSNPAINERREVSFEISRLKFIHAHVWAFLRVLFANHQVSDYLLPYGIAFVLMAIFVLKMNVGA